MIELRGTIGNLAKWFRLCERLVDRSPRMEHNTDKSARVAGGPTSTGVLTRGQMARALREGSLGEARSGGTGGGVIAGAISRVDIRKYLNNRDLRSSCGCVTLAMLMAATVTVAPMAGIPRNSANVPSSDPWIAGSIPRTPGPSVGSGDSVHYHHSDTNQGHHKMLKKTTQAMSVAVVASYICSGAVVHAGRCAVFNLPTDTIRIGGNTTLGSGDYTLEWSGYRLNQPIQLGTLPPFQSGRIWSEQDGHIEDKSMEILIDDALQCAVNQTCQPTVPLRGVSSTPGIHCALVRQGSVTTLYVNGLNSGTFVGTCPVLEGAGSYSSIGAFVYWGWEQYYVAAAPVAIDWVRISNTARYSGNFSPPAESSLISDSGTQLLVTFEGSNPWTDLSPQNLELFPGQQVPGGTIPALSNDCDSNAVPDEIEISYGAADVNVNGIPDVCELGTCVAFGYPGAGSPTDVPADLGNIFGIAAGENFSLAIRADGRVTGWGANELGQCNVPTSVGIVRKIACGYGHSLAIQLSGQLVAWGANQSGQLNVPPGLGIVSDIAAGADDSIALTADGVVHSWGAGGAAVPPGLGLAKRIGAGWGLGLAIHLDGALSVWGNSPFGGTNIPATLGSVVDADASYGHVAALRTDGSIMCWGYNNAGQCNVPGNLGTARAVTTGSFSTVAILPDGTVRAWGAGVPGSSGWPNFGQSTVPANLGPVVDVNAGGYFTLAMVKAEPVSNCLGDIYANHIVDGGDLGILLSEWGAIQSTTHSDLNDDNVVNGADLGLLLANWGPCGK